ncbi:MAG: winged helix-turn-helix domain-containing protein [Planctomycetaceae bacterium]
MHRGNEENRSPEDGQHEGQGRTEEAEPDGRREKVLATAKEPMNCKAIVEAMAKKKLWSSPAGKTLEATLYAALLRHTRDKGTEARFAKAGPGLFTINRK